MGMYYFRRMLKKILKVWISGLLKPVGKPKRRVRRMKFTEIIEHSKYHVVYIIATDVNNLVFPEELVHQAQNALTQNKLAEMERIYREAIEYLGG